MVNRLCSAISWPWSQVSDFASCAGRCCTAAARASATASALWLPAGSADEQQVAGGPLDQGGDRAHAAAEDQVAFPVAGHRAVLGFGWSFADVHDPRPGAATVGQPDPVERRITRPVRR